MQTPPEEQPRGQTRSAQSEPPYPTAQAHVRLGRHTPRWWQSLEHLGIWHVGPSQPGAHLHATWPAGVAREGAGRGATHTAVDTRDACGALGMRGARRAAGRLLSHLQPPWWQTPCAPQPPGQLGTSQAAPLHPLWQTQPRPLGSHTPCASEVQLRRHAGRSHAVPVHPRSQKHWPWWQTPWRLQPWGQVRSRQLAPPQPSMQVHVGAGSAGGSAFAARYAAYALALAFAAALAVPTAASALASAASRGHRAVGECHHGGGGGAHSPWP